MSALFFRGAHCGPVMTGHNALEIHFVPESGWECVLAEVIDEHDVAFVYTRRDPGSLHLL
jgi:hypothetical protein